MVRQKLYDETWDGERSTVKHLQARQEPRKTYGSPYGMAAYIEVAMGRGRGAPHTIIPKLNGALLPT